MKHIFVASNSLKNTDFSWPGQQFSVPLATCGKANTVSITSTPGELVADEEGSDKRIDRKQEQEALRRRREETDTVAAPTKRRRKNHTYPVSAKIKMSPPSSSLSLSMSRGSRSLADINHAIFPVSVAREDSSAVTSSSQEESEDFSSSRSSSSSGCYNYTFNYSYNYCCGSSPTRPRSGSSISDSSSTGDSSTSTSTSTSTSRREEDFCCHPHPHPHDEDHEDLFDFFDFAIDWCGDYTESEELHLPSSMVLARPESCGIFYGLRHPVSSSCGGGEEETIADYHFSR